MNELTKKIDSLLEELNSDKLKPKKLEEHHDVNSLVAMYDFPAETDTDVMRTKDYDGTILYKDLKQQTEVALAMQLKMEKLCRADDSGVQNMLLKFENFIAGKLGRMEINYRNVFQLQRENMKALLHTYLSTVEYSREAIKNLENYQNKVGIEMELTQQAHHKIQAVIPELDSVVEQLYHNFKGQNFGDHGFVANYLRLERANRARRKMNHYSGLAKQKIWYSAKELPFLIGFEQLVDESEDKQETLASMIMHYTRTLDNTEDLAFCQLEKGQVINALDSQLSGMTQTAFKIYSKVNAAIGKMKQISEQHNGIEKLNYGSNMLQQPAGKEGYEFSKKAVGGKNG